MTSLIKVVARSGVYNHKNGDSFKQIAKVADKLAYDNFALINLDNALEDIGITESAVIPYRRLARRIESIRRSIVSTRKVNPGLIQVSTFIEALADMTEECYGVDETIAEPEAFAREFAREWLHATHELSDPRLMFYTTATWFGYLHTKAPAARGKKYDHDRADFFTRMVHDRPRIDYAQLRDARRDLRSLAAHIDTDNFKRLVERRYFE